MPFPLPTIIFVISPFSVNFAIKKSVPPLAVRELSEKPRTSLKLPIDQILLSLSLIVLTILLSSEDMLLTVAVFNQ